MVAVHANQAPTLRLPCMLTRHPSILAPADDKLIKSTILCCPRNSGVATKEEMVHNRHHKIESPTLLLTTEFFKQGWMEERLAASSSHLGALAHAEKTIAASRREHGPEELQEEPRKTKKK